MRLLYSLFLYLLTPLLLVRLWWKGRLVPGYRQNIADRFSLSQPPKGEFDVWVHAVSLGEVIAATPLIDGFLKKKWRVLVTTMTPTGADRIKARFPTHVEHRYVTYDLPWVVHRFFKTIKFSVGVIMETELWPNLIAYAHKTGVPLFLVNARLSERSCRGYQHIRFLIKPALNQFRGILAQCEEDAQRFKDLGAERSRVAVLGNMKFDLQTNNISLDTFQELKSRWGKERVVVMLASTHDNEEQLILSQLKTLQAGIPGVILLVAPRHPERFQKVTQLSQQLGFQTGLRSTPETLCLQNEVVILDSLGELLGFYKISDYAFVGGSLVPVGGHNILEPIAMKVPVLSGSFVHNFKSICRDLVLEKAIILVDKPEDLIQEILALHTNKNKKATLVNNASRVLEANKGAVARYIAAIEKAHA